MNKKIITRKQFEILRKKNLLKMNKDKNIFSNAISLIQEADKYMFIHQNNFFGEPSINFSEDLIRFQEAIYEIKPDIVIEVGVAWGGTTLFLSSILESLNNGKVIGIDIFIPNYVKKALNNKGKISKRIKLLEGSSLDNKIIEFLKKKTKNKKTIVILDSNHTEHHVLNELNIYSKFISKNSYLIVCDTIINYIKPNKKRIRPWNKNNNPLTAIKKFLKNNTKFIMDHKYNKKLLISCNYQGFLKKIK